MVQGLVRAFFLSRSAAVLGAALALSACIGDSGGARHGAVLLNDPAAPAQAAGGAERRVAILLPLSGPNAEIGQALLKAAQLSLGQSGAPTLDQYDTKGTPGGAATAARAALTAGAGLILGPLTAAETGAVAPIARAAGVPVLAFTSDVAQAQPGVWTLGITPAQQVQRLVAAARAENRTRLAAVLPQDGFGDALATGLLTAAQTRGLPEPRIARTPRSFAGLNETMKTISDDANRRGTAPRPASGAAPDPAQPHPPPPMDALLLGVSGDMLGQAVPMLNFYDVGLPQVRILGPALWARDAARQPNLAGAWFAGPDPSTRAPFEQAYNARYGGPARDLASLAYDAAGIARAIATSTGFNRDRLTAAGGFVGADGLFVLGAEGQVRRGLAVFEIDHTGVHVVQPAPQVFDQPGV